MASAGPPRGKIRELEKIVTDATELMAKVDAMIQDTTLDTDVKYLLIDKQYQLEKSLDAAQAEIDGNNARQEARIAKGPPITAVEKVKVEGGRRRRSKSRKSRKSRRRRTIRK